MMLSLSTKWKCRLRSQCSAGCSRRIRLIIVRYGAIDWPAFYWLPSDVFGPGKVLVFGEVNERDGSAYRADMRARLKAWSPEYMPPAGVPVMPIPTEAPAGREDARPLPLRIPRKR